MLLAILLSTGCESECQPDTRMNGEFAASSVVTSPTAEIRGDDLADYPWSSMFFNGWSVWSLEFLGGRQQVKLEIDGQPFTADFAREPEDCTNFLLSFAGTYLSEAGTAHSFSWEGEMAYQGPHIAGTWAYQDTWTGQGMSGSIEVPEGTVSLTRK